MKNENWYRLSTLSKKCDPSVMFGVTDRANIPDYLYPGRSPVRGSTVIWAPKANAHVSIGSYVEAQRSRDPALLAKLETAGIPADIDFGYRPGDDMSSTYTATKKPRAKKADSVKVMRADYAAEYEDGTRFPAGTVVKIVFRKKFVRDSAGIKKFRNVYERPTDEEIRAFLAAEAKAV